MSSLINKIHNPGPDIYYDRNFRIVFEDHLNHIINTSTSYITNATIDPNTAARYAGDWSGLMIELGIFPYMHWYNLRLNGLMSSSDFDGTMLSVSLLNSIVVEKLMNSYKTQRKN